MSDRPAWATIRAPASMTAGSWDDSIIMLTLDRDGRARRPWCQEGTRIERILWRDCL
jgi:hypothetical protein